MKTHLIDKKTQRLLDECVAVDRSVAALAYDYAANELIPPHEHAKAQLIYAIEGTMTVITGEGRWVLLPTRAIWVPSGMRHSIRVHSTLRMRTLFFDPTIAVPTKGCAVLEVSSLLRELILSMLSEPRRYPLQGRAGHLAALIQDELKFAHTLPLHLPWPREARLRKICEAMQRHPSQQQSIAYWADQASMSSRTLSRLFSLELAMTFKDWRTQLLLLEAQSRLAQGQKSSRIARALGYDSHAAFCSMFRKALGTAPMQYFA